LLNIKFSNIDIYNSRCDAVFIDAANQKMIENLYFENIRIHGAGRYGISFNNAVGEAFYRNIRFENIEDDDVGPIPRWFKFTPN